MIKKVFLVILIALNIQMVCTGGKINSGTIDIEDWQTESCITAFKNIQ